MASSGTPIVSISNHLDIDKFEVVGLPNIDAKSVSSMIDDNIFERDVITDNLQD